MEVSIKYIDSVAPPWEYLTFGPWIYLVPQFNPESVLMLGYSGGTVAGLIRLLYGDETKITGVDIEKCEPTYDSTIIQANAENYVREADLHEVVVVDMWQQDQIEPVEFVSCQKFAKQLKRIGDYLILHVTENTDMSAYSELHLVKKLSLNKSVFYYYMNRRVARLPIR